MLCSVSCRLRAAGGCLVRAFATVAADRNKEVLGKSKLGMHGC